VNRRQKSIAAKLEQVAERLLDEILTSGEQIPFDKRLDALKALGSYHLGIARQSAKDSKVDDDDGGPSFAEWRKRAAGERADA
jgi:hypothetical protein